MQYLRYHPRTKNIFGSVARENDTRYSLNDLKQDLLLINSNPVSISGIDTMQGFCAVFG